ncbi:GNAT family N-acetyltransferase, partial [Acidiphilium sp.]|uniref:GNAT family N-acetyltransferase n=1 Tax=Acidiphilium sp. TaxID=527 RepID=UPI002D057661
VRVGQPSDLPAMMAFLRDAHAENGMAPIAEDRVEPVLQCALAQWRGIVGIVDAPDGKIAGAVGLLVGKWWYSHEEHLEDIFTFVREDYRHMKMARPLLDFAKRAARELEMPLLMGVLSTDRTQAKVRLFERKLPMAGALFLYRPDGAEPPHAAPKTAALKESAHG